MKLLLFIALLLLSSSMVFTQESDNKVLSLYYCDFEDSYCGASSETAVYQDVTHIFLAYASVDENGNLLMGSYPTAKIQQWHEDGKQVFLTLGGSITTISYAFNNKDTFVPQVVDALNNNNIDGFDLQIDTFDQTTQSIIDTVKLLKQQFNNSGKQISITTQSIAVYPNVAVPQRNVNSQTAWNIMVPVINDCKSDLDLVQVQMYNNAYLGYERGSSAMIQTVYQIWLNEHPGYPISNFKGLDEDQLIVSILASENAGQEQDVLSAEEVQTFVTDLENQQFELKGINVWNGHWDADNDYEVTHAAALALGLVEEEDDEIYEGEEDGELIGEFRNYQNFLSIYYCGFDDEFCGMSSTNDVVNDASHVILAYVNISEDGELEHGEIPTDLVTFWHQENKKVLLSVGGRSGDWARLFESNNLELFVTQFVNLVNDYDLDGVDVQFRQYENTPQDLVNFLQVLNENLEDSQIVILSLDNVTVYPDPTADVPSLDEKQAWNFFVPVFNNCSDCFDYVQVSVYQNNYLNTTPGSSQFLSEIVKGWLNENDSHKIEDYEGVSQDKLVLSLLASEQAGTDLGFKKYHSNVNQITEAFQTLTNQDMMIKGINLWNSYYDNLNDNEISLAADNFLNLEPEEKSDDEDEKDDDDNNDSVSGERLMSNLLLLALAVYALV